MTVPDIRADDHGFTLAEVLVALALLGLLSLVLVSLARTTGATAGRLQERMETAQQHRTARSLLALHLARAQPLHQSRGNRPRLLFEGDSRSLRFLTAEPGYWPAPGIQAWAVRLVEEGEATAIELRTAPSPRAERPWEKLGERPWRRLAVIPDRLAFRFMKRRSADEPPVWLEEWPPDAGLPRAVRLAGSAPRLWPPLVVPLRLAGPADCARPSEDPACSG